MPKKTRTFHNVRFSPETFTKAFTLLETARAECSTEAEPLTTAYKDMSVSMGDVEWTFDHAAEMFSQMRSGYFLASFDMGGPPYSFDEAPHISVGIYSGDTVIHVTAAARHTVELLMTPFEEDAEAAALPLDDDNLPPRARIFIGHGGSSSDWKTLLIDLDKVHGYECESYETGSRSGHTIRDVLDSMLEASSFALLVFSAEDEQADGTLRARQNVIHETGLFQGRLGFSRAIILREEGTELFSNVDGIQYLQYPKGNIKAVVGDILATLKREFPTA